MIQITPEFAIDENEFRFNFIQASGPGGQNVNKVASSVQLRFDVQNSPSLPEAVRRRLTTIAHKRINTEGILVIQATRHRTQEQNKRDAVERLVALLHRAAHIPKPRLKTRPSTAARRKRLEQKRQHGEIKRIRGEKFEV